MVIKMINKTWESTFQNEPPDGAVVLPPNKLAYQRFRIRVQPSIFFVMILGAKLLTPSTIPILGIFWSSGTNALLHNSTLHSVFHAFLMQITIITTPKLMIFPVSRTLLANYKCSIHQLLKNVFVISATKARSQITRIQ